MPRIPVRLYRDERGEVPVEKWLGHLATRARKAYAKCLMVIKHLGENGNQIRRPYSDYLRDGIHELRTRVGTVNYRILYGYAKCDGNQNAVLLLGLTKEDVVPDNDIEQAVTRLAQVATNWNTFTAEFKLKG